MSRKWEWLDRKGRENEADFTCFKEILVDSAVLFLTTSSLGLFCAQDNDGPAGAARRVRDGEGGSEAVDAEFKDCRRGTLRTQRLQIRRHCGILQRRQRYV